MSYLSKFWASFVFLTIVISALFDSAPSKADIIAVFDENEAAFVEAAESGDFSELEQLSDIQEVKLRDNYVDIFFGGYGFASATSYYGIFYSADGSIDAHAFAPSKNNFVRNGSGIGVCFTYHNRKSVFMSIFNNTCRFTFCFSPYKVFF